MLVAMLPLWLLYFSNFPVYQFLYLHRWFLYHKARYYAIITMSRLCWADMKCHDLTTEQWVWDILIMFTCLSDAVSRLFCSWLWDGFWWTVQKFTLHWCLEAWTLQLMLYLIDGAHHIWNHEVLSLSDTRSITDADGVNQ